MLNSTLSPRPHVPNGGNTRINLSSLKRHPWRVLALATALGAIAAGLFNAGIYAATYRCQTETIDNAQRCHKYQISPTFQDLGIVLDSACPNNPPSYCP